MDLVSVAVPIYNVEEYLERCIKSILAQTYKNLEIMLINDGSPDNSKAIMERYAKKDKRIKCFYKENGGLADVRNYAVKHAKGKFLCYVDSDDWIIPTFVEKMVTKMVNENADLVACEFDRVYNKKVTKNVINIDIVKGFKVPSAWNKLYKLELMKKYDISFPKGMWYEDLAGTSPYVMNAKKISIVNESLYMYYQNNNSIMHTYDDRIFQIYEVLDTIEEYAKTNNLYQENKEGIEFANVYHVLIGTVFRFSFHKDFSVKGIRKIVHYVEKKYPKWYTNTTTKKCLPIHYKMYLWLVKKHTFRLLYVLFKLFNRFLYL